MKKLSQILNTPGVHIWNQTLKQNLNQGTISFQSFYEQDTSILLPTVPFHMN